MHSLRDGLAKANQIRLRCNRDDSVLPLPLGEGRGEGVRSLMRVLALTRIASQSDLSPMGRGESSLPHNALSNPDQ
jgi:hypothetical protein